MTSAGASPPLFNLPAELIHQVLSYLEPLDLGQVAQTCKRLHPQSYDDQIWLPLINRNVSDAISDPKPFTSFRELYKAHHPHWFVTRSRIWFADSEPSGKLLISRYDHSTGSIVAYAVVAKRGTHTLQVWERDRRVIIHSFDPYVSLDMRQPVMKLDARSTRTYDSPNQHPSDRGYAPSSRYSKEILMETFSEAGLYGSFMFCRILPELAITEQTQVWPPLNFPATARTRNETRDGFSSVGHRPTRLSEVSQNNFRLRKWVEYSGRTSGPKMLPESAPNVLTTALSMAGAYITTSIRHGLGSAGVSIRMPEDITTYATMPEWSYSPTPQKPWQGIWVGDYSGHGCEFLVIQQPDRENERPLPSGMDWLQQWFRGDRRESSSSSESQASASEETTHLETPPGEIDTSALYEVTADGDLIRIEHGEASAQPSQPAHAKTPSSSDYQDVPTGRLEAIKLTGDPNIPRGQYTFIAPDIGHGGFVRVAEEALFRGARIVRSAGHIAAHGFRADQYTPSQLIMISHDTLAQFWEGYGHISYYRRVDIDALLRYQASVSD